MAVVGYPIGGDTISVTSGVVSRIEVTSYVHGSTELLGVQIDAAINSGNSGETLAIPCLLTALLIDAYCLLAFVLLWVADGTQPVFPLSAFSLAQRSKTTSHQ